MNQLVILVVAGFLLTAGISRVASATEGDQAAWLALQEPGSIALMRHATAPGTGDPDTFVLGDCSTQRVLDERGRDEARTIGRNLSARGITFDRVLSSQWCRCLETAHLLDVGTVEPFPPLNSFFGSLEAGSRQTEEVRQFIRDLPHSSRFLLVTHQVNITALTGIFPASGEIIILQRAPGGSLDVAGSIRP